jgi:hypothetical protein
MNMTSLNRIMTFAVFVPGGLILGGCASLGVHDTQSLLIGLTLLMEEEAAP